MVASAALAWVAAAATLEEIAAEVAVAVAAADVAVAAADVAVAAEGVAVAGVGGAVPAADVDAAVGCGPGVWLRCADAVWMALAA
jgi:hypothetical protein